MDTQPPPNLRDLFDRAVTMPPEQRAALLNWVGARWPSTRMELEAMLAEHARLAATYPQQYQQPAPPPPQQYSTAPTMPYGGQIGSYRLVRELGHGGMGTVFLAIRDDDAFRKTVALKVIRKEAANEDFIRRFKLERQILAALDHPHITRIIDGGTTLSGEPYYVMDYVEGSPLEKHCDQHQLPVNDRVRLMVQLCDAVAYLHDNAIIHRDLKPGNVLVDKDGRVRLLDFGIAKVLSLLPAEGAGDGPTMIMTPGYASPEQIGGKAASRASDQYSLAVILYLLLTGKGPYTNATGEVDFTSQLSGQAPPAPSTVLNNTQQRTNQTDKEFRRRVVGDLDRIVLKALQADPARRYESVAALARDLQNYLDGRPVQAGPNTGLQAATRVAGKNKPVIILSVLLLFALAGGGYFGIQWYVEKAKAEARQAELEQLFDGLDARLPQWQQLSSDQRQADVKTAARVLEHEAATVLASGRGDTSRLAKFVERAMGYFDRAAVIASNDSRTLVEVAAGYEKAGNLHAVQAPAQNWGSVEKAKTAYRKAATVVLTAPNLDDNERQAHLTRISARSGAVGAPLNFSSAPAEKEAEAAPEPAVKEAPAPAKPNPTAARPPSVPQPTYTPPAPVQTPKPAAPAVVETKESRELAERLDLDAAQVARARKNVEDLRKRLADKGQGVQADIDGAMSQAQAYLDIARSELGRGDVNAARDRLTQVEYLLKKVFRAVGN